MRKWADATRDLWEREFGEEEAARLVLLGPFARQERLHVLRARKSAFAVFDDALEARRERLRSDLRKHQEVLGIAREEAAQIASKKNRLRVQREALDARLANARRRMKAPGVQDEEKTVLRDSVAILGEQRDMVQVWVLEAERSMTRVNEAIAEMEAEGHALRSQIDAAPELVTAGHEGPR